MFQAGVNVSGRYRKWPVFSRPLMAGFGCPPREGGGAVLRDGRAVVRVSLVCSSASTIRPYRRRGWTARPSTRSMPIWSARRGGVGIDLTDARCLAVNASSSFKGDEKGGPFSVPGDLAREWLRLPANPNGRTNADVLKPWINGMDVTRRSADKWNRRLVRRAHLSGQSGQVVDRDRSRRRHNLQHRAQPVPRGLVASPRDESGRPPALHAEHPFPPGLTPDIPCQRVCLRPACCGCRHVHHAQTAGVVRHGPEWSINDCIISDYYTHTGLTMACSVLYDPPVSAIQ